VEVEINNSGMIPSDVVERFREAVKSNDLVNGVWIVYGIQTLVYPMFISKDELIARRFMEKLGSRVWIKFWKFDTEWSNV
jgi:hypothetical protein